MAFIQSPAALGRKMLYFLLLLSCVCDLAMVQTEASQNSSTGGGAGWQQFLHKFQLPDFAVPIHYDLRLKPDLTNFTFSGSVRILLNVTSPTEFLVFNAYRLEILDSDIQYDASSEVLKPVQVWKSKEDQIFVLEFSKKLPLGTGNLTIRAFSGNITDFKAGLYKSPYRVRGEIDYMAVTQFQPLYARGCFPCWDEPALKATFKIILDVQSNLTALSNMPIIKEELQDNWKTVSYEVSPVMPTYAVAVVVGMFDYVENVTSNGVKVRVYTPVGEPDFGKFSLDVAVRSLDIFERYLGVQYPLPKLDMIGVPLLKWAGMENFGLITCYANQLYVNNYTTIDEKRATSNLVAHEVAHMWFGNLVTMKWWKYFWLNEGFATWFQYYAVDQIFPEWDTWAYHSERDGAGSFLSDVDSKSIPVEMEVNNFNDILDLFGSPAIIYQKAAYIIRMLNTYLGPEIFQHSISSYIKEFSWSSVDSENLWAALEKASGKPVKNVMSQWTKITGYPVVSVETSASKLLLKQSPILSGPSHASDEWTIPLTLCCGSYDTCYSILMNQSFTVAELSNFKGCSCGTDGVLDIGNSGNISSGVDMGCPWIKVNVNQTGFFRVIYENNLASRLAYTIKQKNLSHADRFGIINDLNELSVNYNLQFHYLFTLIDAYAEEDNPRVITALIPASKKIVWITADAAPKQLSRVKTFFAKLLQNYFGRLGWDSRPNEIEVEKSLRSELLRTLAILGDESTLEEATKRFHAYVADNHSLLHTDIKEAIFMAVMQKANKSNTADYESLLRIFNMSSDKMERLQILNALTSCPDPQILREVLDLLFSPKVIIGQIYYALDYVSWQGRETAWTWLKENWANVSNTYPFYLPFIVTKIVSPLASLEKADEVKTFFSNKTLPSFAADVESSILEINKKVAWAQRIRAESGLAGFIDNLTSNLPKLKSFSSSLFYHVN
ncbi:hypothetical protein QQ045_008811 [Rhodiola kirilowii]